MPDRLDAVSRELVSRLDERQDEEVVRLTQAYRGALEQMFERAAADLPRDDSGRFVDDSRAVARLNGLFRRFGDGEGASLLIEQHVDAVQRSLGRVIDQIDLGFARLGSKPLEDDRLVLSALVRSSYLERLSDLGRYHHNLTRDAILRSVLGRRSPTELRNEFRRLSDKSTNEADRIHHDALIGFSRSVNAERAAQHGFEWFQYMGPNDGATRPFCRKYVDRVLTREEIDALDNGQIGPVIHTGGGYRCRHHWRPVRREWFDDEEWQEMRGDDVQL